MSVITSRVSACGTTFSNPIIWADVPDVDVIRMGDAYYMSSTTMYFNPGVPIMKSYDLVNWKIVNYVYDIIDNSDTNTLRNGKNSYGKGSWASSLRYNNGKFYVSFVANNTGKTYIYHTEDIEKGPWERYVLNGFYHDMSILFDDDGRVYMVYGGGTIRVVELNADVTKEKSDGMNKVIIEKANVAGDGGLNAEGAHIYKHNGMYYIFLIAWPPANANASGKRVEICYRSDKIDGEYEGRVLLDDDINGYGAGVAQGGMVDTPDGDWYCMLFQDHGSVGRVPVLVPMTWSEDGWPVLGVNGKVPENMPIPELGYTPGAIICSDDFNNGGTVYGFAASNGDAYRSSSRSAEGENVYNGSNLALEWQWNHNPDNRYWSLIEREGFLRLTTGQIVNALTEARNTLTQRTFGPTCYGYTLIDVSRMKDGDTAGLVVLQEYYGYVGVKAENGEKFIVMINNCGSIIKEVERVPLTQYMVYLRSDCNFADNTDTAVFYYSLNGEEWIKIGDTLRMSYRLSHFTGYRYGLFNFATQETGGYADFDCFVIGDKMDD